MVAGVLLQGGAPDLIDSAGIELDTTLGSWDYLWNRPVERAGRSRRPGRPVRRRGRVPAVRVPGARRLRRGALRVLGGRRPRAPVPGSRLALRPRLRCARAARARADARRRVTRRAAARGVRPRLRAREVPRRPAAARFGGLKIAALDWPVLAVHLVLRREAAPARERLRARSLGLRAPGVRAPLELATVGFGTALRRQVDRLRLRSRRGPAGPLQRRHRDAPAGPVVRLRSQYASATSRASQARPHRLARDRNARGWRTVAGSAARSAGFRTTLTAAERNELTRLR